MSKLVLFFISSNFEISGQALNVYADGYFVTPTAELGRCVSTSQVCVGMHTQSVTLQLLKSAEEHWGTKWWKSVYHSFSQVNEGTRPSNMITGTEVSSSGMCKSREKTANPLLKEFKRKLWFSRNKSASFHIFTFPFCIWNNENLQLISISFRPVKKISCQCWIRYITNHKSSSP